jgi:hypothetical protein
MVAARAAARPIKNRIAVIFRKGTRILFFTFRVLKTKGIIGAESTSNNGNQAVNNSAIISLSSYH